MTWISIGTFHRPLGARYPTKALSIKRICNSSYQGIQFSSVENSTGSSRSTVTVGISESRLNSLTVSKNIAFEVYRYALIYWVLFCRYLVASMGRLLSSICHYWLSQWTHIRFKFRRHRACVVLVFRLDLWPVSFVHLLDSDFRTILRSWKRCHRYWRCDMYLGVERLFWYATVSMVDIRRLISWKSTPPLVLDLPPNSLNRETTKWAKSKWTRHIALGQRQAQTQI